MYALACPTVRRPSIGRLTVALWIVGGRRLTRRHEELTRSYSGRRREPGQASMRSRRFITPAIVCIAASSAAMPAAAPAGSLLSGYGGPGQGSQAIIGSSLVNGPPNRGGGGGSAGAGESAPAARGNPGTGAGSPGTAPTGPSAHNHSATPGRGGKRATGGVRGASGGGSRVYPASARDAAVRTAAEGSNTLGVSGMDLLYILLALGALLLTGVLTRRIASTSTAGRGTGS